MKLYDLTNNYKTDEMPKINFLCLNNNPGAKLRGKFGGKSYDFTPLVLRTRFDRFSTYYSPNSKDLSLKFWKLWTRPMGRFLGGDQ
jgi:hypothetical protein